MLEVCICSCNRAVEPGAAACGGAVPLRAAGGAAGPRGASSCKPSAICRSQLAPAGTENGGLTGERGQIVVISSA